MRSRAQTKAVRLLSQYLSPAQASDLRRKGEFLVTTTSGHTYRISGRRGRTEEVTRHGRHWFVLRRFCLHDGPHYVPDEAEDDVLAAYLAQSLLEPRMPPADLALTHLLLLLADEQEFLSLANATDARDMLWNGTWMRRLRAARLARQSS